MTATDRTDPGRLGDVLAFLVTEFSAQVAVGGPEWHDRVVAVVSHLPHVLAARLLSSVADLPHPEAGAALAAGSFRDGTRVAGGDTTRTAGMVVHNREAVREQLTATIAGLTGLLERLDDDEQVAAWFETARRARTAYLSGASEERTVARDLPPAELVGLGEQGWLVTAVHDDSYDLVRGALNSELRRP
ncbi:prephenate dehydrogenase dimerization domain-containing protein [Nocardioides sp. TF02-7]|uniref:prephenate dehydrogenase dimerization domain-containing protein n=1 Tax=Nocardioides sp. TF02-7 TaxID=2917724 RepID=UPI0031F553EF